MNATIRHHTEECECDYCGHPLDVGDRFYRIDDLPYCSPYCADSVETEADRNCRAAMNNIPPTP